MDNKNRERMKLIKTTVAITFPLTFVFWILLHLIVYGVLPGPLGMLWDFLFH